MRYIDEKFKETSPEKTVETIRNILKQICMELEETWNDSGIENCWSLRCNIKGTTEPTANGKGITKDFARASAYGEFMERLQSGLFFYKFQSIEGDEAMNLLTYAPDKKYMTLQELTESGEWMDYLIDTYGSGLSREKIARQCHMYACTGEDKILTVPYYSLLKTNTSICRWALRSICIRQTAAAPATPERRHGFMPCPRSWSEGAISQR